MNLICKPLYLILLLIIIMIIIAFWFRVFFFFFEANVRRIVKKLTKATSYIKKCGEGCIFDSRSMPR